MVERMLNTAEELIITKSVKRGEYVTGKDGLVRLYYIVATDNPSIKDYENRLIDIQKKKSEEDEVYILYPALEEDVEDKNNIKTIMYNDNTIEKMFEIIYDDKTIVKDMGEFLLKMDARRSNAKD